MTDPENIPQGETRVESQNAEPSTLAVPDPSVAGVPDAHTYPPAFLESELPPSPEQLAAQTRISKIPPDLRVPWDWADLGVFLLFYLGSTVVLLVMAMVAASSILGIPFTSLQKRPVLLIAVTIVAQAAGSIAALFYFWVLARVRHAGKFWRAFGWHSLNGDRTTPGAVLGYLFGGVALAIAVTALGSLVKQSGPVPFEEFFKARQTVLMIMAFGILVAPLVEETIFRGFLYPVAARQFGVVPGILFTGTLFGGFHAMQLWGAWGQISLLVVVGIVLTWVRARTGSVLASFLLHVAYNSTLFAGLYFGSHGLSDFPIGK
jgi:membrane protease YdiL (CAAX protease family)